MEINERLERMLAGVEHTARVARQLELWDMCFAARHVAHVILTELRMRGERP